jgi:hypothetical protein
MPPDPSGAASSHEALLRRFQPQLLYDSNEAFFADSAAEWTDNPGNVLRRYDADGAQGDVLAAASPEQGQEQLRLDFLGHPHYRDDSAYQKGDAISNPKRDYRDQYVALRQRPGYSNRMYGRAKKDADGHVWLQYWFFYFYNDYNLAGGIGLHEGDWEMVQLRMHDDAPDLAVYAQHTWAERRPWDQVDRLDGSPDTPLVYVARGSHASYFRAGYHETEAWYDMADGKRAAPKLALELIDDGSPSWVDWPGSWGDTRPRVQGIDQPSPNGPSAHTQWPDPKDLVKHSRTPTRVDPAHPPEVEVARRDGRLVLEYDFSKRAGPEPQKLVVTVNSIDDRLPPRTFTFPVDKALKGTIAEPLGLNEAQHYDVYVSTTDAEGKPSESKYTEIDPAGETQPGGGIPILPWIGRVVAWIRRVFGRGG